MAGWVKLYRSSIRNGWLSNRKLWVFWTYCLMKAMHKKTRVFVGFERVELMPGQFVFGLKKASIQTGLSVQNIRTCLRHLKTLQNLTVKSTNRYSIITIVNWERYQATEEKPTSKSTSIQQASNNIQECKEKNKYTRSFLKFWSHYPKKRQKLNAFKAFQKQCGKVDLQILIDAVEAQKKTRDWKKDDGQYIPYPASWINAHEWENETQPQQTDTVDNLPLR